MDPLSIQMFQVERLAAAAAEVLELSRRAAEVADGVRTRVPQVAGAFDHAVWRGPAAEAAAARAGDQAASVSRAAAQLDEFAADLARHGRAAANRAEVLRMALVAIQEHEEQEKRPRFCTPGHYDPFNSDAPYVPYAPTPESEAFAAMVRDAQARQVAAQNGANGS